MTDTTVCHWLMDSADAPIRYCTARELLQNKAKTKAPASAFLAHAAARRWFATLVPKPPPPPQWRKHGSFDFFLENTICKAVQLGLHGAACRSLRMRQAVILPKYSKRRPCPGSGRTLFRLSCPPLRSRSPKRKMSACRKDGKRFSKPEKQLAGNRINLL